MELIGSTFVIKRPKDIVFYKIMPVVEKQLKQKLKLIKKQKEDKQKPDFSKDKMKEYEETLSSFKGDNYEFPSFFQSNNNDSTEEIPREYKEEDIELPDLQPEDN
jgi:hypothetical protein